MKRLSFISAFLLAVILVCGTGCEGMDAVRANPISLEVDGRMFMSNPDTTYALGRNDPDQVFRQYGDYFTFGLCEKLYSKKDDHLVLQLVFQGSGIVELNQRYPLKLVAGHDRHYISYDGKEHEVSEGWIEFSEFGVNGDGDTAYVSGTYGLTMKEGFLKVANGSFGRMLECIYYNYMTPEQ